MLFHQSAFDSSSLPFFPNSQTINKPNHPSSATNSISKSPFSSLCLSLSLMAKATKESNSTKPKPSSSHPPYSQMICDAIVALKERTGSSQYAISKFIEEKHKPNLPPNFKKTLLSQLKKLVAAEKLVKIKNSFKISTSSASAAAAVKPKPKPKPKATAATKLKPAAAAKPKAAALAKPKPKPKQRPVKVATKASPGKKMKMVKAKKPKSIKSPVKKAVAAKKVKKAAK